MKNGGATLNRDRNTSYVADCAHFYNCLQTFKNFLQFSDDEGFLHTNDLVLAKYSEPLKALRLFFVLFTEHRYAIKLLQLRVYNHLTPLSSSQVWDFSLSLLTSLCYKVPNKIPIKSSIYHGNSNFGNQLLCLPRLTQLRMSQNLGKFMLPRSGTTHPDYDTGNLLVLNW